MNQRRVFLWAPDLFFATRIAGTARSLGVALETPARDRFVAACRETRPDLIVIDLASGSDPIGLARELKADAALATIPIVGFYPHVEQALRVEAEAAGVDRVMPRSAFTARLADLLGGERRTQA